MGTEERYDGKTRKDDRKQHALIALLVILLLVALGTVTHLLKKAREPDYTVVDLSEGSFTEETIAYIREVAGPYIGDRNGNGKVRIAVKSVRPEVFGGYDTNTAALFTGDYVLFFVADPTPWYGDILAEEYDLEGTALWDTLNLRATDCPYLHACILNTNDHDMDEARQIINAILDTAEERSAE